jgi:1,4-dihydroxy-2-naphthoate octaprenyltransferase
VIPFVIDMINNVHSLQTDLPMDFTNEIYVGKNNTSSFFFFVLNFFPIVIPLVNTEGNIPSVFPFVFINFLVVNINKNQVEEREKNKRTYMPHDPHSTTCTADL